MAQGRLKDREREGEEGGVWEGALRRGLQGGAQWGLDGVFREGEDSFSREGSWTLPGPSGTFLFRNACEYFSEDRQQRL